MDITQVRVETRKTEACGNADASQIIEIDGSRLQAMVSELSPPSSKSDWFQEYTYRDRRLLGIGSQPISTTFLKAFQEILEASGLDTPSVMRERRMQVAGIHVILIHAARCRCNKAPPLYPRHIPTDKIIIQFKFLI